MHSSKNISTAIVNERNSSPVTVREPGMCWYSWNDQSVLSFAAVRSLFWQSTNRVNIQSWLWASIEGWDMMVKTLCREIKCTTLNPFLNKITKRKTSKSLVIQFSCTLKGHASSIVNTQCWQSINTWLLKLVCFTKMKHCGSYLGGCDNLTLIY